MIIDKMSRLLLLVTLLAAVAAAIRVDAEEYKDKKQEEPTRIEIVVPRIFGGSSKYRVGLVQQNNNNNKSNTSDAAKDFKDQRRERRIVLPNRREVDAHLRSALQSADNAADTTIAGLKNFKREVERNAKAAWTGASAGIESALNETSAALRNHRTRHYSNVYNSEQVSMDPKNAGMARKNAEIAPRIKRSADHIGVDDASTARLRVKKVLPSKQNSKTDRIAVLPPAQFGIETSKVADKGEAANLTLAKPSKFGKFVKKALQTGAIAGFAISGMEAYKYLANKRQNEGRATRYADQRSAMRSQYHIDVDKFIEYSIRDKLALDAALWQIATEYQRRKMAADLDYFEKAQLEAWKVREMSNANADHFRRTELLRLSNPVRNFDGAELYANQLENALSQHSALIKRFCDAHPHNKYCQGLQHFESVSLSDLMRGDNGMVSMHTLTDAHQEIPGFGSVHHDAPASQIEVEQFADATDDQQGQQQNEQDTGPRIGSNDQQQQYEQQTDRTTFVNGWRQSLPDPINNDNTDENDETWSVLGSSGGSA